VAGANSVRLGQAYVEIFAEDGALRSGLTAAANRVKAWGASITSIGSRIVGVSGGVLGASLDLVKSFKDQGNELNTLSLKTGASVERLSELQYIFEQSGAKFTDFSIAVKHMQRSLGEAAGEGKAARTIRDDLAHLGLTLEDFKGLDAVEQFRKLAGAIGAIKDPTERINAAMGIFWVRTGQQIMPVLSLGAAGMNKLAAEARDLGIVMSSDQASSANDLKDAWNRLDRVWNAAKFTAGSALAPTLVDLLGLVTSHAGAVRQWTNENRGLILSAVKGAVVLGGLGAGLVVVGTALSAVGSTIGLVASGIGMAGASLKAMFTPMGLVFTAIRYGATGWLLFTEDGKKAAAGVREAWSGFGSSFLTSWDSILSALNSGDLQHAIAIVSKAVEVEWAKAMISMGKSYDALQENINKTLAKPGAQAAGVIGGALSGAAIGSRFGPYGAAAGTVIGGIGGYAGVNPAQTRTWAGAAWDAANYVGGIGSELFADASREVGPGVRHVMTAGVRFGGNADPMRSNELEAAWAKVNEDKTALAGLRAGPQTRFTADLIKIMGERVDEGYGKIERIKAELFNRANARAAPPEAVAQANRFAEAEANVLRIEKELEALRAKPPAKGVLSDVERLREELAAAKNNYEELIALHHNLANDRELADGSHRNQGYFQALQLEAYNAAENLKLAQRAYDGKIGVRAGEGAAAVEGVKRWTGSQGGFRTMGGGAYREFSGDALIGELKNIKTEVSGLREDLEDFKRTAERATTSN